MVLHVAAQAVSEEDLADQAASVAIVAEDIVVETAVATGATVSRNTSTSVSS
jgi:hypothetical protein